MYSMRSAEVSVPFRTAVPLIALWRRWYECNMTKDLPVDETTCDLSHHFTPAMDVLDDETEDRW